MVRSSDTDRVDIPAGQQLAIVTIIGASAAAIGLIDAVPIDLPPDLYGIADSYNAGVGLCEKGFPVVAVDITRADQAERDTIARRNRPVAAEYRGREYVRKTGGARNSSRYIPHKTPTCYFEVVHLLFLVAGRSNIFRVKCYPVLACLPPRKKQTVNEIGQSQ
jgi:hypothetical protein